MIDILFEIYRLGRSGIAIDDYDLDKARENIADLLLSQPELQMWTEVKTLSPKRAIQDEKLLEIRTAIKRVMGMEASDE